MKDWIPRFRKRAPAADPALERWRQLLSAASTAEFYAPWREILHRAQSAPSPAGVQAVLARIPEIELSYFFDHFERFRSAVTQPASPQPAGSLWSEAARLAVAAPWFRVAAPARVFTRWDPEETARFSPEAIAAPVEVLGHILEDPAAATFPNLFAAIALAGVGTPIASEELRLRVWRRLGVPLHIQFRGFHGEPLASECPHHEGLHAEPAAWIETRKSGELLVTSLANLRFPVLRLATRLEAETTAEPCPCGRPGPRLLNLRFHSPKSADSLRALAAAVGANDRDSVPRMLS